MKSAPFCGQFGQKLARFAAAVTSSEAADDEGLLLLKGCLFDKSVNISNINLRNEESMMPSESGLL